MYVFFQCRVCQRCQNCRSLGYVEQTVDWVNMPVTEVVAKGFFPHFFAGVAEKCYHNDVSPRGGAGVRRSVFRIVGECLCFFWITSSMKSPSLMKNIV